MANPAQWQTLLYGRFHLSGYCVLVALCGTFKATSFAYSMLVCLQQASSSLQCACNMDLPDSKENPSCVVETILGQE